MHRVKTLFIGLCLGTMLCAQSVVNRSAVVLYDNDVHCKIEGYAVMAGLRDSLKENNIPTLVVSSGDYVQGGVYGAISKGQYCIDAINACGYDVVAIGNHEFDYGMERHHELMAQLTADVVNANLYDKDNHCVYKPYVIKEIGGLKIAFVGVLTPGTVNTEYYAFQDEQGNLLYTLCADSLAQVVQRNIDEIRVQNPNFVVLLTHMGEKNKYKSTDLVAQLRGVDVVLDSHSHDIVDGKYIKDADQHDVLLTQTGTGFQKIGKLTLTIADGKQEVMSELLDTAGICRSAAVDLALSQIYARANPLLEQVVGHTDYDLTIFRPDGSRAVRQEETNMANVVCDAFRHVLDAQIGLCNGGGVRASIPQGDITYQQVVDVSPFSNDMCVLAVTGQQLMDFIEFECRFCPAENGDFVQVGGLQYIVDTTVHNQLEVVGEQLMVTGERRVHTVNVLSEENWVPVQPNATYTVATSSYVAGLVFMKDALVIKDKVTVDQDAVIKYVVDVLKGQIPAQYAAAEGRIRFEKTPTDDREVDYTAPYDRILVKGRIYIRRGNSWVDILGNSIH